MCYSYIESADCQEYGSDGEPVIRPWIRGTGGIRLNLAAATEPRISESVPEDQPA
jgi:hypothetical protein